MASFDITSQSNSDSKALIVAAIVANNTEIANSYNILKQFIILLLKNQYFKRQIKLIEYTTLAIIEHIKGLQNRIKNNVTIKYFLVKEYTIYDQLPFILNSISLKIFGTFTYKYSFDLEHIRQIKDKKKSEYTKIKNINRYFESLLIQQQHMQNNIAVIED
ncbi:hypothetical protein ABPG74_002670 [Tetrahymena malaccensis]